MDAKIGQTVKGFDEVFKEGNEIILRMYPLRMWGLCSVILGVGLMILAGSYLFGGIITALGVWLYTITHEWRVDINQRVVKLPDGRALRIEPPIRTIHISGSVEYKQSWLSEREYAVFWFDVVLVGETPAYQYKVGTFEGFLQAKQIAEVIAKVGGLTLYVVMEDEEVEVPPQYLDANIIERLKLGIVEVDESVLATVVPDNVTEDHKMLEITLHPYAGHKEVLDMLSLASIGVGVLSCMDNGLPGLFIAGLGFSLIFKGLGYIAAGWKGIVYVDVVNKEIGLKGAFGKKSLKLDEVEEIWVTPFENNWILITSDFDAIYGYFTTENEAQWVVEKIKHYILNYVVKG